ncbi:MAG: ABC transporter ATP-binding protein [Desulfobacteraceae bacterium]|jgi:branched-chain amino acid transport system ATP-binding protein|nr:MAG: ABC transporter ATP-binding protein [Desulfobacteraceae bacterium]
MDFGGLRALEKVDLYVAEAEIVAIIGPNGAGKTTFFNCITCVYQPHRGDMIIYPPGKASKSLNGLKPNTVTEMGIARTFQNIRLFKEMTVLENVMVGRHCRTRAGIAGAILCTRKTIREEQETLEFSYGMLRKVGLEKQTNEKASDLPYGAQRRLEIARALATEPFLLLLDEPAAGMNPSETAELDELISRIREEDGISILLIEHDMKLVMNISDRIYVLDYGHLIAEGTPQQVTGNPEVIKAYLGECFDA